jgi:hypothetical protein
MLAAATVGPLAERAGTKLENDVAVTLASPQLDTVHSELGGLFYLLNVALHLGHYGDFTTPVEPGLTLSPWDWVAVIGRRLLPRARRGDPVWSLLAGLAGRTDDSPPGVGFWAPRVWRVPRHWITPLPDTRGPWIRWDDSRRLRVRHPLGFTVLDARLGVGADARLARELRRYRPAPRINVVRAPETPHSAAPPVDEVSPALARWAAWTAEYVGVRLRFALATTTPAAAARLLLRHRAIVVAGRDRVTVRFSLNDHPVAIRMAGLDRDPGFIPAAGRTVVFHYD